MIAQFWAHAGHRFGVAAGQRLSPLIMLGATLRTPAGAVTAVPFDFDSSGLVDAGYAGPPPASRVRSSAEPLDSAERRAERIVAACRRPGPQDE
jgi:hypothetical protein